MDEKVHILGCPYSKASLREIISNMCYCPYRHNFETVGNYSDDCGWGCTIRSFQMLLGNTLMKLGCPSSILKKYLSDSYQNLFSLQNILKQRSLQPGDWLSPSTVAKCLEQMPLDRRVPFSIRSYPHLTNVTFPLLLLVSTRLGSGFTISEQYLKDVESSFRSQTSAGIVGGRKGSSYYFIGSSDEGIYYLDPHRLRDHSDSNYVGSKFLTPLPITQLDPSMTFGFLVEEEVELENLITRFKSVLDTVPPEESEFQTDLSNMVIEEWDDDDFVEC